MSADGRGDESVDPPYLYRDYRSTILRAPSRPLHPLRGGPTELAGPTAGALLDGRVPGQLMDLTRQHAGEPIGERIIVHGRVLDAGGRPLPGTLVEIWQANAAGRYAHDLDRHPAPLDPSFTGAGWCTT